MTDALPQPGVRTVDLLDGAARRRVRTLSTDRLDGACYAAAACELDTIDVDTGLADMPGWRPLDRVPPPPSSSQPARR